MRKTIDQPPPLTVEPGSAPRVGAVVVTLNAARDIHTCLESLAQCETVVVDHGSTDGTVELVARAFTDVVLVKQENHGLAAGWNRGMLEFSHVPENYLIINADAWMTPGSIDRLVEFSRARPDAAVVGPRVRNPDGSLQPSVRSFPTTWRLAGEYLALRRLFQWFGFARHDHSVAAEVDWVMGAVMLVRAEAVREVGMLDENFFLFGEEVDWCYRFRKNGWRVYLCPDATATHIGGASHGGRMVVELAISNLRYIWKHHGLPAAMRTRRVMLAGLAARGILHLDWRRDVNQRAFRALRAFSVAEFERGPRESVRWLPDDRPSRAHG